ncbi:MAG: methyltransferase domain-containing protein [Anaerolineae bacterium]|nr:methyltransferase domain-containing protein [Anaerolineae bacterium]
MSNENQALKAEGATFWNINPCGGTWNHYQEFITWMQNTEPYLYEILGTYSWSGKKVLEVGCGQGTVTNYLPTLGTRIFSVDMSSQSLKQTRQGAVELNLQDQIDLAVSDAESLPFPNNSFDIIISGGVLHHTPNTQAGIDEIYRTLKPGGKAIIMLYRSGNPKWWTTYLLRTVSQLVDKITDTPHTLARRLQAQQQKNSKKGTALIELFGVPILKAYSNREAQVFFQKFGQIHISNHQAGFVRLIDILPILKSLETVLRWVDRKMKDRWGFYQVIEARK